jgi:fatty-acid peroxygenase
VTDLALALRRHGYRAVERERARRGGGDDFAARLLGHRAVVLRSDEGVRAFYDESLVARAGAVPAPLKNLLFGQGAVHGLDGVEHDHRKQLLRSVVPEDGTGAVVSRAGELLAESSGWWRAGGVTVFDELVQAYGSAVLDWAGVEVSPAQERWIPRELARIVDGFGGALPAFPRGWVARRRTDRWLEQRVVEVRRGDRVVPDGSALRALALAPLPSQVAAVELGNVLRPTVAVSWLGTSAVLQLVRRAEWRERLATPEVGRDHLAFAQEVRRHTPFVPVLAGRARRPATVGGLRVGEGDRLVLDVRGVDTDPARWASPETFDAGRFLDWSPGAFDLVPQGGGPVEGHRCPGESLTIRLLAETVRVAAGAAYRVPDVVGTDLTRIPTLPDGGLELAPVPAPQLATPERRLPTQG